MARTRRSYLNISNAIETPSHMNGEKHRWRCKFDFTLYHPHRIDWLSICWALWKDCAAQWHWSQTIYTLSIQFVPDFIKNNIDHPCNAIYISRLYRSPFPLSPYPTIRPDVIMYIEKMSPIHAQCTHFVRKHPINKDLKFIRNIKEFPLFTSNFHLFHCTSSLAEAKDIDRTTQRQRKKERKK